MPGPFFFRTTRYFRDSAILRLHEQRSAWGRAGALNLHRRPGGRCGRRQQAGIRGAPRRLPPSATPSSAAPTTSVRWRSRCARSTTTPSRPRPSRPSSSARSATNRQPRAAARRGAPPRHPARPREDRRPRSPATTRSTAAAPTEGQPRQDAGGRGAAARERQPARAPGQAGEGRARAQRGGGARLLRPAQGPVRRARAGQAQRDPAEGRPELRAGPGAERWKRHAASAASSRPAPISARSPSCIRATSRPRRAARWTTPTAACCPRRGRRGRQAQGPRARRAGTDARGRGHSAPGRPARAKQRAFDEAKPRAAEACGSARRRRRARTS